MTCLSKEIIGVIHLPRLPSSYIRVSSPIEKIIEQAVWEARILDELGYSGVIVENYGDTPFTKRVKDPLTLSSLAVIIKEVVKSTGFKVGVNLLRNSGKEAYCIAVATGAKFIRVNALIETLVSDSGIIEPEAPLLKPLRLNHPGVEIYADILVKHAISLRAALGVIEATSKTLSKIKSENSEEEYLRELVEEYVERGGANALIVTGIKTGELPPLELVKQVKKYAKIPVIVGSGVTAENVENVFRFSDGVIVGSYIKENGKAGNKLDPQRAEKFAKKAKEYCP